VQKLFYLLICALILANLSYAETWISVSAPSNKIAAIETIPQGIVAGEFDDRMWLNPYNGIYLSEDGGINWKKIGLNGKGVKNLEYRNGTLYASAYYTNSTPRGLYYSPYPYDVWNHVGPLYEITALDICGDSIYMGTKVNGLMVSRDKGATWAQKLGNGWDGPEILAVRCFNNHVVVSTRTNVFTSANAGETWNEASIFSGTTIYSIAGFENYATASGIGYEGLFVSYDSGDSWSKIPIPGFQQSKKLVFQGQYLYIGSGATVLESLQMGKEVKDTLLSDKNTTVVADLAAYKPGKYELVALSSAGKIYKREVDEYKYLPTLSPPWNIQNDWELTEKINSFFDHQYPLLSYPYMSEPQEHSNTTLKYDGEKGSEPQLYYSSHSGIDFDMDYGDPVLAAASGSATNYYCKSCGNTIKIDHGNGIQTVYMHLQNSLSVQDNGALWVESGREIGKVGLTGRTTGPHLHFEVVYDTNNNSLFSDEFPHGRTDPFGWNFAKSADPWPLLKWTDPLGHHQGAVSKNLWEILSPMKDTAPLANSTILTLGNKIVEVVNDAGKNFLRLILEHAPKPRNAPPHDQSKYINGTATILNLVDQLGNASAEDVIVKVKIFISPENIMGIIPETIKLYRWEKETLSWVETISRYDSASGVLEGILNHLSYFAAFGEGNSEQPPSTQLIISPEPVDGLVDSFATVSFIRDGGDLTVYSLDGGDTWNTYSAPVTIDKHGMYDILYKSQSANGAWEETKSFVLKVGTDLNSQKIRVVGAEFETLSNNSSP